MASTIEKKALEIADAVAQKMNVFVVGAEYKKEDQDKILRLYIDKTGGVGIDECEKFSRAFEACFDELNIVDEAYNLEVSSPGVDRILKTQREYDYYSGREVDIKLYKAVDGIKEFTALLKEVKDDTAYVVYGDKELQIPTKEAVYIRLSFKF